MTKTILLVEDNASDEKLTLLAFKSCGIEHAINVVRDGAQALDYLFARGRYSDGNAPRPALVLLDISLPKVDGFEVLRQIRASDRTRLVPVITLTASLQDEDVQRSYDLGANAYVRKPVEFPRFEEAAKIMGAFWLALNETPAPRAEP